MNYGILGPLEVWDGSRRVRLPSGRARALLALLILHAGESVRAERLIDELWGEQPPPTAPTALQGLVSKLRKELGRAELETAGGGYRLVVDPNDIDAERFKRLIESAPGAAPESRARVLHEALELWRGPALVDFMYEPFAQRAISSLEEKRLSAIEDRIDADLSVGRPGLVAEIDALVEQHPLRERLRALQMLALYRDGRQADALEAYRVARTTMDEEMGIELGPALQQLQRSILQHDRSLQFTPATAAAGPWLPGERSLALSLALAEVYLVLGRFAEAQSMLRDVIDAGDATAAQAARLENARIQFIIGPDPIPLANIEREAAAAAEYYAHDDSVVQRAVFLVGCVRMREGRMVESEAAFRESLALADRGRHMRERLASRWMTGEVLVSGPVPVRDAIAQLDQLEMDLDHPGLLMQRGVLTAMDGPLDEADGLIQRAREVVLDVMEAPRLLLFVTAAEATLALLHGDIEAAEAAMRARLEIALHGEEREGVAQAAGWLALLLRRLGRKAEAEALAQISAARAPFGVPGRAIALAASGDARAAVDLVPDEMPNLRADMLLALAWELRARDDEAGAHEAEDQAAQLYGRKGNVVSAERLALSAIAPS